MEEDKIKINLKDILIKRGLSLDKADKTLKEILSFHPSSSDKINK